MSKIWTQEKIDMLIMYLRNGVATTQIAKKFNTTCDAISGAIRRYDLFEHNISRPSTTKFVQNINLENLNDADFEQAKKNAKLDWKIKKSVKKS